MLKKLCCMLLLSFLISSAFAQRFDNPQILKRIGLSDETIEQIIEINTKCQQEITEAELELNIFKAQLEKLLFSRDADLNKVEKLLENSMEWKLKSEMARIKRRVMIRQLMDEEQWVQLVMVMKSVDNKKKENNQDK